MRGSSLSAGRTRWRCPSTYAGGRTIRHGRITKQGLRRLRWALIEAADPRAREWLVRLYRRPAHRRDTKIPRVAVACELCLDLVLQFHLPVAPVVDRDGGDQAIDAVLEGDLVEFSGA